MFKEFVHSHLHELCTHLMMVKCFAMWMFITYTCPLYVYTGLHSHTMQLISCSFNLNIVKVHQPLTFILDLYTYWSLPAPNFLGLARTSSCSNKKTCRANFRRFLLITNSSCSSRVPCSCRFTSQSWKQQWCVNFLVVFLVLEVIFYFVTTWRASIASKSLPCCKQNLIISSAASRSW